MAKYIDADQLIAEIERRHAYQKEMYNKTKPDGRPNDGWAESLAIMGELEELRTFLDTLPEQEHPIYELNQILLDWVREAKTDKEQEARFEAYKRFFELYDEYMMQEPEQPVEGLEEEVKRYYSDNFDYISSDQPTLSILTNIARHFAEWQKVKMGEQAREQLAKDEITLADLVAFDEGCSLGRRLERQNMLKDAVKGMVCATITGTNAISFLSPLPDELSAGDKVRVIVIKEDEK